MKTLIRSINFYHIHTWEVIRVKRVKILQQNWIIELSQSFETFFIVSIRDMPTIKYCQNSEELLKFSKERIPKKYKIGDTCFTSLEHIGGNLFIRY